MSGPRVERLRNWTEEDDQKLLQIRLTEADWVDTAMQRFGMSRRQVEYRVTAIRHRLAKDGQPMPEGIEAPVSKANHDAARNAVWNGKIELLKQLWMDGFSASQIAVILGDGITRNAVIGKINRLGLQRSPNKSAAKIAAVSVPRAPKPVKRGAPVKPVLRVKPVIIMEEPTPIPEDGVDVTHLVGILKLDRGVCRWPVGDPQSQAFGFCGCETKPGSVYCGKHYARAYIRVGA